MLIEIQQVGGLYCKIRGMLKGKEGPSHIFHRLHYK